MTTEGQATEAPTTGRRVLIGRVVSDKMDKTVTVEVTRTVKHGQYHKFVTRRKKYHAHDENNECKVDDDGGNPGEPSALQDQALGGDRASLDADHSRSR